MSVNFFKTVGGAINVTFGPYNGYLYFFHSDGTYSRFNRMTCEIEYYAPMGNWNNWPSQWQYPYATASWDNQYVYFLHNPDYVAYNLNTDRLDGPMSPMTNFVGWPSNWMDRVDAALYAGYHPGSGRRKAYFFRDDEYIRYDLQANGVESGYLPPAKIAQWWPGWPAHWRQVWAAVDWGNGKIYFFSETEYLRYDKFYDQVDPGYPLPLYRFIQEHQDKLVDESQSLFMEGQVPPSARPGFVGNVRAIAKQLDIRPNWLMASMWMESGFNPQVGRNGGPYVGLHQMSLPLIYGYWGRTAMPARYPDLFHGQPFEQLGSDARLKLAQEFADLGFDQIFTIGLWLKSSLARLGKCRSFDQFRLIGFGGVGFAQVDGTLLANVVANSNPRYDLNKDGRIDVAEFRAAVFDILHDRFKNNPAMDSALRHSLG